MKIDKYPASCLTRLPCVSDSIFVSSASYETRCLTVPLNIGQRCKKAYLFWIDGLCPAIGVNLGKMKACLGNIESVKTNLSDPINSASVIDKSVDDMLKGESNVNLLVDITTFTHEHLLFLLKSLYCRKEKINSLKCVYASALEYSYDKTGDRKWLSKGCKEVRSVIGYPGMLYPDADTLLMIVVGFEHERASCVIDEMSPDVLYLGLGSPDSATSDAHKGPQEQFNNMLASNISIRRNAKKFVFSASDPEEALRQLKAVIEKTQGYNHIVVPMNTKLSTLAVASLGLHNKDIQLCYAQPDTYNFDSYSRPGEDVHLIDVTDFILS